jgi:hypothetical protein
MRPVPLLAAAALLLLAAFAHAQGQPRPGACCISTPSAGLVCIEVTRADCTTLGGLFGGEFSRCNAGNVCAGAPTGACCIAQSGGHAGGGGIGPPPICTIINQVQCTNRGGVFQGNGTTCAPPGCPLPPTPTGACCFGPSGCTQLTSRDCRTQGGNYRGDNTACTTTPCPGAPRGACCVQIHPGQGGPSGSPINCILTDAVTCANQGGIYQGDNTTCRAANCPPVPPPTGACCRGGSCSILTAHDCRLLGGNYRGNGSDCATTSCPGAPTGACCIARGNGQSVPCVILDEASCRNRGGIYRGDATICQSVTCISSALGACCVRSSTGAYTCVEIDPVVCTILGGTFSGLGIPCSAAACPPPCPCDINGDGVVNAADEAAFLLLFAAGNADFDQDGDTDLDDWAAFYSCYPQGCP